MTANLAMIELAALLAAEFGYVKKSEETINAADDWFWGNKFIGLEADQPITVESVSYIDPEWPEGKEGRPNSIKIDMHWGNPRLSIQRKDGCFACLTYTRENNAFSEAQAFGATDAISFALEAQSKIDTLIQSK